MEAESRKKPGKHRYDLSEHTYKFNKRINTILARLEDSKNYNVVKLFVQELKLAGLKPRKGVEEFLGLSRIPHYTAPQKARQR